MKFFNAVIGAVLGILISFSAVAGESLVIKTSGGSWDDALRQAWFDPFTEERDISYVTGSNANGLSVIKAQVETNKINTDMIFMYESSIVNGCEQGLLEPIADEFNKEDYVDGAVLECGVGVSQYATITAANEGSGINSVQDFFDPSIPGQRGLTRWAEHTLELALLGAGIEPNRVADYLKTEEGQELALATIDSISDRIIWFKSGAQANQLLIDRQVVATMGYDARFNNAIDEGYDINILWDGFVSGFSMVSIPKGAPNKELALDLLKYMTSYPNNLRIMEHIRYSPVTNKLDESEITDRFSMHPDNKGGAVTADMNWWADHSAEMNKKLFQIINQ